VLKGELLQPGVHVDLVGSFTPEMREADDVRADLFELCQGRQAGRTSDEQLTLMKNGGGSHLD
jgi:ornithine cyclodeaminase/alanine dehydrogenase-like protein (mu-crystallin family)